MKMILCTSRLLLAGILFLSTVYSKSVEDPLDHWTVRSTPAAAFTGIAFSGDVFLALNEIGQIYRSTDAEHWELTASTTTNSLWDAIFGNGVFVAVGDNGIILVSTNGLNWSQAASPTQNRLYGITYYAENFIAVGRQGTILTSTNGLTWTPKTSEVTETLTDVKNSSSIAVTVGLNGVILTSTNGSVWTRRATQTSSAFNGITYGGGLFVAVGEDYDAFTSADGISWARNWSDSFDSLLCVAYGNGRYVAVGDSSSVTTSSNGVDWSYIGASTRTYLSGIAFGNGTFACTGPAGIVLTSRDGLQWTEHGVGGLGNLSTVVFVNGQFFAIGQVGLIMISTNGTDWIRRIAPLTLPAIPIDRPLAFGNGVYVGLGNNGSIVRSTDLLHWTSRDLQTKETPYGIAYGNGVFVVVGSRGLLFTSTDGTEWTARDSRYLSDLVSIVYSENRFVSFAQSAFTIISTNGLDWFSHKSNIPDASEGVTIGNGSFVLPIDSSAFISRSYDGLNYNTARPFNQPVSQVGYSDGIFVALDKTNIFSSLDLENWTSHNLATENSAKKIALGNNTCVLLTDDSRILQSQTLPKLPSQVLKDPSPTLAREGDQLTLIANVTGSDPKFFQWYRNGIPITGATNLLFELNDLHPSDVGSYSLAVSNGFSVAQSTAAAVFIEPKEAPLNHWHTRHTMYDQKIPKPPANVRLSSIAAKDGLCVAVGSSGTILTSTNLFTWTRVSSGVTDQLNKVINNGNLFVAVGDRGTVISSSDGQVWRKQSIGTRTNLSSITYGNGKFITASVYSREAFISDDAITWTRHLATVNWLIDIAYGNNAFVALESKGMLISHTGEEWQRTGLWSDLGVFPDSTSRVIFHNGSFIFFALNQMLLSENGTEWTKHGMRPEFSMDSFGSIGNEPDVPFAGIENKLLAMNSSLNLCTSDDGIYWLSRATGIPYFWDGVAVRDSFLAVGDYETIIQSDPVFERSPSILLQPEVQTAEEGSDVRFFVGAVGTSPITYQWRLNGQIIPGATNDTLTVRRATRTQAGAYDVLVSNRLGSINSSMVLLTVSASNAPPPQLKVQLSVSGEIELVIMGTPGKSYVLQSADELSDPSEWKSQATFQGQSSPIRWVIPKPPIGQQFYRVLIGSQ